MTSEDPILLLDVDEKMPGTVQEVLQKSCVYPMRESGDNSKYDALRAMENRNRLAKAERAARYTRESAELSIVFNAEMDQMDIDLAKEKDAAGFSVTDYTANC